MISKPNHWEYPMLHIGHPRYDPHENNAIHSHLFRNKTISLRLTDRDQSLVSASLNVTPLGEQRLLSQINNKNLGTRVTRQRSKSKTNPWKAQ